MLVLGSLGMVACWSGNSSKPETSPSEREQTIVVAEAEIVVGSPESPRLARKQAIEQARAAGILGKMSRSRDSSPRARTGPLDRDSIRREIRARLTPIALCYEERLLEEVTLQGTTKVTFVIGADGRVTSSRGSGFDAAVDGCVANVVKGVRFPAPDSGGTMRVSYPFKFRPADEVGDYE